MDHDFSLILTFVGGLTAALLFGLIARKLHLSPLVGYLLAGVVVGPYSPGFVADSHTVEQFAELGVILLMFGVGLHFHLKDLIAVQKVAVPGAVVQISVATVLGVIVGWCFGWSTISGLVFGMAISAELFQSLNPIFVVSLTPVIMAVFAAQRAKGKEPSTPRKIAIGMGIAATGFLIMAIGSYVSNLPMHKDIIALGTSPVKVTPLLLMVTYLILTVAELYISPLGISFVSKVAPPKYQGIMQGGWLGATAIGNQLLVIGAILYESIPIWMTWTVFVVACCISMFTMLFMLKWLEKVAK